MNRNFRLFNIDLTDQNKLIIMGVMVSTIIIIVLALISISKIQDKLYEGYSNFGQLLTKTLAIQTYEQTRDLPNDLRYNMLKNHADSILKSNKDISFITFKDAAGKIIYSTASTFSNRVKGARINISSPVKDRVGKIIGIVEVGLTSNMASSVVSTTKNSMVLIFTAVWIIFALVIVANSVLIARELTMLHHGVKEISSGKFGTMLDYSQASGEIKELFAAFNDMSKRLHAFEEQNIDTITLEKNKLEAVLMSIANGVVVCNNFDKITIINNAAQQILSANPSDILGTHIQNYCDTNGVLCFKEKIDLFKNTPLEIMEKKPLDFNVDVDERVVKTIVSPIYSKAHDYLGYILVLIDITKEAEVDKLKSDFISNVSHELRTPVTVLRTYADTLYNYGNDFNFDEQKEFIGTINQEVIRLNKMVNDVLDFSKLQNDSFIEKTYGNIVDTIKTTMNSLQILADEKNIAFSLMAEPDIPEIPYSEESIERVLNNLITNAIKYSNVDSRIKIRAEIADDPEFVQVTVQDFGVGIPKEFQEKIFDRFYRIENDTHTIKGTGLGLNLAKIAIEKHHHGEIFVESTVGEGSTFGFRLPIKLTEKDKLTISAKEQISSETLKRQEMIENLAGEIEARANVEKEQEIIKEEKDTISPDVYTAQFETLAINSNEFDNVNEIAENNIKDVHEVKTPQGYSNDDFSDWEVTFEVREKA